MSPKTPKEEIKKTKPVSAQTSVNTKTNHKADISEPDKTQTNPKPKKSTNRAPRVKRSSSGF